MQEVNRQVRLIKVEELADVLSVPRSWVYQQTAAGTIPHVRVGRYVRFDLDSVMAWLAEIGR